MSRPDASASAALGAQVIRPAFFCFLDIVGDPLRATTAGRTLQFEGTGDPDLDGHIFDAIDSTVVDIGPVRIKEGGSDSVIAKLSGLNTLDNELLNTIGNKANWQGRVARLWRMIRDEHGGQAGALQPYYTGWMTGLIIVGSPESQTIEVTIEGYLAAYTQPSNRTYLDAEQFDPGDLSARAAIAIANGISGNPTLSNTPTSFGDLWRHAARLAAEA
ncbi:hypothetical protein CA223_05500 [Sphingomonas koreensis]|uniref:Uncharacterized protein n=1 Tax=Sphingomonas koreensis TaxID=93064 RepID=A0A1L6JC11_9SPHN|nr:hypothetical protein [Sphingomonas koreensis]APR53367.1 hypothetical protein BRX40_13855 [Sphingomonas koreensis]MDC7809947.1 hypothetical protein [Sphingomonas koreensis]RSU24510.1 hypothetical protein CA224_01980 [Sphingomonas koreensis]RSU25156.1 hypothetical protein CA222_13575 [Sphingomonas koreensis]RSU30169.1 hypothetical protein CA225_05775 [Sphingomonas koreensis]